MIEVSSLLLMVLGEILIVTTVISVAMIINTFIKKSRDRTAINSLIGRVKEDAPRRLEETRKIVSRYGLKGESLDQVSAKIARDEKVFYQSMINLYLKRDSNAIQNFNIDFETAVDSYRSLEVSRADNGTAQSANEAVVDTSVIDRLTMDNERLSEELKITMDTMGRMLSEYSSMFAGESGVDLDKAKMVEMRVPEEDDADSAVDLSDSGEPIDTDLEQLKGLLDEDDVEAINGLLDDAPDDPTVQLETTHNGLLDDDLDPVALTDEDLADIADMDQTIVMTNEEDDMDAASVDALIQSHSDPNR